MTTSQPSPAGPPSPAAVAALRARIGLERLSGYDAAASGDQRQSLLLYQWNSAISAAVFEDLSILEVTLRNACHEQLRSGMQRRGISIRGITIRSSSRATCKTSRSRAAESPKARNPRPKVE